MFDFIIIGSGAGGGTLARKLAPSGKKILIIERGDFLPVEPQNSSSEAVFDKQRYVTDEKWLDKNDIPFQSENHYFVGGSTKFYGAALIRFKERDFQEVQYEGGISPAWPVTYNELAPYYTEAEKWYHVHGERGSDPLEARENNPYPLSPLPHESCIQKLYDELTTVGLQPFPLPIGVDLSNGDPAKILDKFDGYPDGTLSKGDAHTSGVLPAIAYENVTLWTNCYAEKLLTDESGKKVTGVKINKDGKDEIIEAHTVVVACGAVNTAALLLRSANKIHQKGLANSSGVVGRHYMYHNNSTLRAFSPFVNSAVFGKTFGITDFYYESSESDFPMGLIQMMGKSDAVQIADDVPDDVSDKKLTYIASHAFDFWLTTEDLPLPENRITLTKNNQIKLSYTQSNTEAHEKLKATFRKYLDKIGCSSEYMPNNLYFGGGMPIANTAHQCGTVRFGNDPVTSAVDKNGKAHDLDNLYVVDASVFPSSTSTNPGLTVMALAIRAGEYLLNQTEENEINEPTLSGQEY